MTKHPGPWTLSSSGFVVDAHGITVCGENGVTNDHETRAVLIHAAEMWEALRDFEETPIDTSEWVALEIRIRKLTAKIESEIAKGKP